MSSTESQPAEDRRSWWERAHEEEGFLVAYFSPEFGVDAALPVYSGGLGVLAGDHLKSAGDLGIPLVGVGLLYGRGYFRQDVIRGRQRERYPQLELEQLGLRLESEGDGRPLVVEIELEGETVSLQIWRREVRGIPLYLLDSNLEENSDAARNVTDVLYGGDREHRIRQELVLGVGGSRAIAALGLEPSVFHLNEGHAAFLALERIRVLVEERGLAFDEALGLVRSSTVFTTHTPVPAGNERFEAPLARRYLEALASGCGVGVEKLLELGAAPDDESFGLTPLALRTAEYANGVSEVHGDVSRGMWQKLWAERQAEDVPIGHVTNAVHAPTWVSPSIQVLLAEAGVTLTAGPGEQHWERALGIDAAALWRVHAEAKTGLLQVAAEGGSGRRVGGGALDPAVLTIGFARRFATYKRAGLLFSDRERFAELLADSQRPIQFVFAGKAHPADEEGKAVLAEIVRVAGSREVAGRIAFLPGYDMALAQSLVSGVDVWLNTPRPPHEASGTSGMKAALNGVLNLSVLDGWWAEAYAPAIGWAISSEISAEGDAHEAAELLRLLAEEVAPAYYELGADGVPERWVRAMTASIATVGASFNGARMLEDYVEGYYLPAHRGGALRRRQAQALGSRRR